MRIPFPERITPWHAGAFACLIAMFEMLEGTQPLFALGVFFYIMVATAAFNLAGGLYRASGAYVFANALLGLIVSQVAKVVIGEPADANLRSPITSIMVYCGGMVSILVAVAASRRFIPKVAWLDRSSKPDDLRQIAVGCIVVGLTFPLMLNALGNEPGTVGSAFQQFASFSPLGLMLATYDQIRSSHGRRSTNLLIIGVLIYLTVYGGILGTSKQGLFTPLVAYGVACGALRFKFKPASVGVLLLVVAFMLYYLVPYSQVVRNYTRDLPTFSEQWAGAVYWMSHLDEVRAEYNAHDQDIALDPGPHYYDQDRGFLERLGALAMDDALINVTELKGPLGLRPIVVAAANLVPHAVWKDKPEYTFNNSYAHEIGILSSNDLTTSISFGPSADGYHQAKWMGVLVVMPLALFILFVMADSVAGSVKTSPWGLLFTLAFLHAAPEATLGGCIVMGVKFSLIIVGTVVVSRYVLPFVGSIIIPERRKTRLVKPHVALSGAAAVPPPPAIHPGGTH